MNIILEGLDAAGKTTLSNKLKIKYNMSIINSTSKTRNDFGYHINLLDYQNNVVLERFHFGEMIYPIIYNRDCKLSIQEYETINKRIIDNNDLFIVFISSDMSIINKRLKERGEDSFIPIMEAQNKHFTKLAKDFKDKYNYKNFYIIDIAEDNAYDKLDSWIDSHYGKTTTNIVYRQVARDVLENGHPMETRNTRGHTLELCNYSFSISDLDNEYVSLKSGGTNLTYLAAELLWYWSSRNDLKFISKFASLWEKVSDDGLTANSAYGYLIQQKYGFNQIEKIVELLKKDPYSRRAIININIPNKKVIETKDEPCTICLNYQIRNKKLHSTTIMRSNDLRYGVLNDLGFFISLQKYIAELLDVDVGTYNHYAMSLHIYDKDIQFFKDIAYGTLESSNEVLNIKKLLLYRTALVNYVDDLFISKKDFKNKLIELEIIKEN